MRIYAATTALLYSKNRYGAIRFSRLPRGGFLLDRLESVKQRVKTEIETGALSEAAGLAILEGELAVYWRTHGRPQPKETPTSKTSPIPKINEQLGGTAKIWPFMGFAAIRGNHGGAWRAWVLAKALDTRGSGQLKRAALVAYLRFLGLDPRSVRRWIREAIQLGLFTEKYEVLSMVGLVKAAQLLGVSEIGNPVIISAKALTRKGWRGHVWAAYLAMNPYPISQATKELITGVNPRTQRNWQQDPNLGSARSNWVKRTEHIDYLPDLVIYHGRACFVTRKGEMIQRLPDSRNVPMFVAMPAPKGRTSKAQERLELASYNPECAEGGKDFRPIPDCTRGSGLVARLFYEKQEGIKEGARNIRRSEAWDWEKPKELFQFRKYGRESNLWTMIPV